MLTTKHRWVHAQVRIVITTQWSYFKQTKCKKVHPLTVLANGMGIPVHVHVARACVAVLHE